MSIGSKLLSRLLVIAGLALLLLAVVGGLWQVNDALPRCLAGLFLTVLVPSSAGMLLVCTAITFEVSRRWWAGCLTLLVLASLCLLGGLGLTRMMVGRKLSVERRSVEHRCAALRQQLSAEQQRRGSFPAELSGLSPHSVQSCALQDDALSYVAGLRSYLLALPGSSLDIDGSTFFAGAEEGWLWLGNDLRAAVEQRLADGEPPEVAGAGNEATVRYATLLRQPREQPTESVRPVEAAGDPDRLAGPVGGSAAPGGRGGSGAGATAGNAAEPALDGQREEDLWVVPEGEMAEGHGE